MMIFAASMSKDNDSKVDSQTDLQTIQVTKETFLEICKKTGLQ